MHPCSYGPCPNSSIVEGNQTLGGTRKSQVFDHTSSLDKASIPQNAGVSRAIHDLGTVVCEQSELLDKLDERLLSVTVSAEATVGQAIGRMPESQLAEQIGSLCAHVNAHNHRLRSILERLDL